MTPNKEDYLKCIYELSFKPQKITNKNIAALMQVSAPAVTEMIKKLIVEELLIKDSKSGYCLTDIGQKQVASLYRKHRLIEVFLINHLNYTVEEVHEEAEILEHTVSDLFIERLDQLLDYPETCPHGGTIPAHDQPLIEKYQLTLDQASQLGDYQLVRVHDDFQLLKYLDRHLLQVGSHLTLIAKDDYAGTITIATEKGELQVPSTIAENIYVEALQN